MREAGRNQVERLRTRATVAIQTSHRQIGRLADWQMGYLFASSPVWCNRQGEDGRKREMELRTKMGWDGYSRRDVGQTGGGGLVDTPAQIWMDRQGGGGVCFATTTEYVQYLPTYLPTTYLHTSLGCSMYGCR
jgi:hypothetical protein